MIRNAPRLAGHELDSQTVFTVYSVFMALQFTVATLPYGIKCISEAKVSFAKIQVRPSYSPLARTGTSLNALTSPISAARRNFC